MTNMVSLPDNEQRHLTIGKQALQKGNYASAAAHLEKAYEATQTFAIAQPLAASLNGLKQFHESLNVMLAHYQSFMQTDGDVQLVLDAWLGTLNFVMARTMLRQLDPIRRQRFRQQIEAAEALALNERGEQIAELVRKVSHLGGFPGRSSRICLIRWGYCQKHNLSKRRFPT